MSKTSISTKALLASTSIGSFARHMAFAITGLVAVTAPAFAIDDNALPTGGSVAAGSANFDYNGNLLNVNQNSQNVVIDWSKFNIGQNAVTQFNQPNVAAIAVNRVHDVDPSYILGALKANGQVVVLNANGVVFGQNSHVDVAGLLVSTGDINTSEFMNTGKIKLSAINAKNGTIETNGQINVATGGMAAFIAPNVVNNGIIQANLGKIELASGADKATVDMYGDGLVELALDDKASKAVITNNGTLRANGGKINITVKAAKDIVNSVVNMNGVVEANSFEQKNGVINLDATNADVKVAGKVSAQGGNGKINVRTNKNIDVAQTAEFNASAGAQGNGGTINIIADGKTDFAGSVISRGGEESGNGGSSEISGYEALGYSGYANLGATNGQKGSLLLDPTWAIIHSGAAGGSSGYLISAQALANAMETTDVTVQADQFIDVGAKDSYGSTILDVLAGAVLGNGNIDLSKVNYNTYQVVYTTVTTPFGSFQIPTGLNTIVHNNPTTGTLVLQSATVNFNKDTKLGTGNLDVQANTVNLNGKLSDISGGLVQTDITTTASTVNVLSNAAYIQQGLYLAAAGGTVNVSDGTYTENLTVNKAVTLRSENGAAATKITGVPSAALGTIVVNNAANTVKIGEIGHGFTINGSKNGIYGNQVNNLTITGNALSNVSWHGIQVEGGNKATITNNEFTSVNGNGVQISGTAKAAISGNKLNKIAGKGINATGIANLTVSNNEIGLTGGVDNIKGDGIAVTSSNGAKVTGNTISETKGYGIVITNSNNTVVGGAASTDTNIVTKADLDGIKISGGTGSTVENNTVSEIGRVGIYAGTANSLTIKNNRVDNTTFAIGSPYGGITTDWGSDITISGNTVSNSGHGVMMYAVNGTNTVDNNTINNTSSNGINITSTADATVTNNKIGLTGVVNGSGIYANGVTSGAFNSNTINGTTAHGLNMVNVNNDGGNFINMNNNIITGAKGDGIHIEGGLRLGADSNTISNTTGNAIYVKDSGNTYLTQNHINTTGKDGIYVEGVNSGFVGFNDTTLTTGNGINAVNTNDTTFLTNLITKASKAGVKIAGGLRNTFKDNTLKNIGNQGFLINGLTDGLKLDSNHLDTISWTGIQMDGGKNASFVNNDITKTNDDGFRISGTQTVDVSGNTVTKAKGSAITANGTKNATIKNNTLTTSGSNGIKATGGQLMEIVNNIISGTGDNGILVNGLTNVVAKDNTIGGFVNNGIDAENITTLTAQNNTITGTHTNDAGIYAFNTSNATIKDNTINNASYAIFLEGNGTVTKGLIDNNTITGADAQAIHTRSNAFADITNNNISSSSVGIVTENMYGSTGSVTKIQNNIIAASKIGIRNNLSYGNQAGFLISDNTITAENPAEARRWTGIDVISQMGGVATTFQNNSIDGSGAGTRQSAGYELTNITNTGTVIDGGSVSNVDVGVWATDGSFYTGAVNDLLIKNVAFNNNRQTGILVEDTEDALNQTGVNPTGTKVTIGAGNTFTGTTPYDLTIAGDNVTIALAAGFNGVQKTFVKAAGPAHYVGNPNGTTTNLTTNNASINTGIGATAAGGTVTGDTGTFKEVVLANKGVTLTGLASTGTIIDGTGLSGDGIRVSADNVTLKDLTVQKWTSGIDVRTAINNLKIKNVTSKSNNSGFKVANSGSILGLTVSDSHFDNNTGFGWYISKDDNNLANTTTVNNVIVSDTTFDNNGNKGIYAEKLDNAKFTDVSASNNTVSGIDINLKNGNYTDIVFNRLTVTGSGNGVAVKARNDAPYTATPATLSSLIIKNSLIDVSGANTLSIGNAIASAEIFNNNAAHGGGIKGAKAITVYGGAKADIHDNDIKGGSDYGIAIANAPSTVWRNNIDVSGTGIVVAGATGSLIGHLTNDAKGNTIKNAAYGIVVNGATDTTVAHNTVLNSGWDAIQVVGGSTGTKVLNNTIDKVNGASGIAVMGATNTTVADNTIKNVARLGIFVQDANGIDITTNKINNTGTAFASYDVIGSGIAVVRSSDVDITANKIGNTTGDAINIGSTINGATGASNVNIENNKIGVNSSILGKGIQTNDVAGLTVFDNTIRNTTQEGIFVTGGSNAVIDTNDIAKSDKGGIYATLVNKLNVIGNTIKNVSGNGIEVDGGRNVAINDNTVNHSAAGIVANNTKGRTKINNNIINNVTGDAIYAFNNKQLTIAANEIGLVNNNSIGGNGITVKKANTLLVKGNTINKVAGNGIDMTNIKAATVQNNKVKGNSKYGLFFKSGVNGSLVLTNNKIESLMNGTSVGARFEGGQIDLTSANKNTFIGGENGLEFSGSKVSLKGNTFGTTKFKDQNGYYIALSNGGLFGAGPGPQILDARQVNFDGFTPGTFMLNFADWQALTAKLYDYNDLASLGLIFFDYPVTDINDILPRQRYGFDGRNAIGSVTITGLPYATLQAEAAANTNVNNGAFAVNPNNVFNLITNAGPNSGKKVASAKRNPANDAADLNNIETAAGGNETAGCWAQVYSHFGHSTSAVTYNLDSSPAAMLADQASCK